MQHLTRLGQPLYTLPIRFWEISEPIPCMLVSLDGVPLVWHMGWGQDVYISASDLFTTREAARAEIQARRRKWEVEQDEARERCHRRWRAPAPPELQIVPGETLSLMDAIILRMRNKRAREEAARTHGSSGSQRSNQ